MLKLPSGSHVCPEHGAAWVVNGGNGLACYHDDHSNTEIKSKPERSLVRVKSKVERLCWEELERFFSPNGKNRDDAPAKIAVATLAVLQKENQFENQVKRLK